MTVSNFLSFSIEFGISLAALYFIYWIFLRKETYFQFNRLFLAGSIMVSCLIPLGNFGLFDGNSPTFIAGIEGAVSLPEVTIYRGGAKNLPGFAGYIQYPLIVIYLFGSLLILARLLLGITKVNDLRRKGKTIRFRDYSIVYIPQDMAPFSFFRNIFINESLIDDSQERIVIDHELVHIRQHHTLDKLMVEIFLVFFWFNPILWLVRSSLRNTHEYLADQGVRQTNINLVKYQSQLLQQIGVLSPLCVTNNFNSMIKNRIIMMCQDKSSLLARFKPLLILPVVFALVLVFACTESDKGIQTNEPIANESDMLKSEAADEITEEENFFVVEEMPDFQGQGQDGFRNYLSQNMVYPEVAARKGISGKVFVQFAVNSRGKVVDAVVVRGIDPALDKEALRVVNSSPLWTPGKQRGKEVKVQFTFPVNFTL